MPPHCSLSILCLVSAIAVLGLITGYPGDLGGGTQSADPGLYSSGVQLGSYQGDNGVVAWQKWWVSRLGITISPITALPACSLNTSIHIPEC